MGESIAKDRRTDSEERAYCEHCVWLVEAQRGRCAISGIRMDLENPASIEFPSNDRLRLDMGHVEGNVVLSMYIINISRRTMDEDTFYKLIDNAVNFHRK
jgi:hypothetical protein